MMKRNLCDQRRTTDWKLCVIFQSKTRNDAKDLRYTEQGLLTLSRNLVEFWKIGKLDIDWNCLTNEF